DELQVFRRVARRAPAWVVAVLLAPAGIPSRGQDVTVRDGTDPHVRPGRWDDDGANPCETRRVGDARATRTAIAEALPRSKPADSQPQIVDPPQVGIACRRLGMLGCG